MFKIQILKTKNTSDVLDSRSFNFAQDRFCGNDNWWGKLRPKKLVLRGKIFLQIFLQFPLTLLTEGV